jgi:UDP-N-acetylmuramoylalanine--D-glutamate ligase
MTVSLDHLRGATIGVYGLARSGLATVEAAIAGGAAKICAWDDRQEARDKASALGATIAEAADWPWKDLASLVLSPGVPLTHPKPHPVVGLAGSAGVEIVCDIELLWRERQGRNRFVAITGTNGKSTTTALLGHLLKEAGRAVAVGGNIGRSALDLEALPEGGIYVLEMSSYQLDLTRRFRPDVAIWLNLTADHLDRHGDMAGYRRAKEKIFAAMAEADTAVVGIDEPEMHEVADALRARAGGPRLVTVSVAAQAGADLSVDRSGMLAGPAGVRMNLADLPTLRGAHNWQNGAFAFAAASALGVPADAVHTAMRSFPGLAHRMEIVAHCGRVLFVNDSKATNADAAARALQSFDAIYWIAGGLAKSGGIEPLAPHFPRIEKAYLIGAAADAFAATLARRVPHVIAADLGNAVRMAAADAAEDERPEPVVLLSPACASFDQFADFEARGEFFRKAVEALDRTKMEAFA